MSGLVSSLRSTIMPALYWLMLRASQISTPSLRTLESLPGSAASRSCTVACS